MKRNSITRLFSSAHQSLHVLLLIVPIALWFAWCLWCLTNWLTNGARMSLPKSIRQLKRPALVLLFAMVGFAAPAQTIRYVKQGGSGDGSSWTNASSNLQAMINVSGNTSQFGGGLMAGQNSTGSLTNCSMSGNSAQFGGAMYTFSTQVSLTNCILWGNNTGIGANPGIFANVSYSIVQQSSGVYPGTGNLNLDPLFVGQPPVGLGTTGNLQLQECSPAIDAGTNTGAPDEDFDANPRPFNAVGLSEAMTDMGAWEYQSTFVPEATASAGRHR